MSFFLSRYINKIDKKGRISVPAIYRASLEKIDFNGIIVYPSFKNHCIEACSMSYLMKLNQIIETLDPYSEERDAFATIILGEAVQVQFDQEGRVGLPSHLIDHAEIVNNACFVGKGAVFEIWDPDIFESYLQSARVTAAKNKLMLKNTKLSNNN